MRTKQNQCSETHHSTGHDRKVLHVGAGHLKSEDVVECLACDWNPHDMHECHTWDGAVERNIKGKDQAVPEKHRKRANKNPIKLCHVLNVHRATHLLLGLMDNHHLVIIHRKGN